MCNTTAMTIEPEQDERALELVRRRLSWYRREARKARLGYQYLELAQLVAGALVPLAVAVHWDNAVAAGLGAVVVCAGGARAVFQWHDNWLAFIDAQMRIERQLALYEVGAAPYGGYDRAQRLVLEVEAVAASETQRWRARRESDLANAQPASKPGSAEVSPE